MVTVSMLVALLALGVAVAALVWCQRLADSETPLPTNIADAEARERLAALAGEFPSLHARVDHLRQCWQADTGKLESLVRQLEERTAGLEQGSAALAALSRDLDGLRDFRREVESVLQQLESKLVGLEQGYGSLGTLSKDLDNLRAFRDHVEHVHAGIQKAFNGSLAGTPSALRRDEKTS